MRFKLKAFKKHSGKSTYDWYIKTFARDARDNQPKPFIVTQVKMPSGSLYRYYLDPAQESFLKAEIVTSAVRQSSLPYGEAPLDDSAFKKLVNRSAMLKGPQDSTPRINSDYVFEDDSLESVVADLVESVTDDEVDGLEEVDLMQIAKFAAAYGLAKHFLGGSSALQKQTRTSRSSAQQAKRYVRDWADAKSRRDAVSAISSILQLAANTFASIPELSDLGATLHRLLRSDRLDKFLAS